MGKDNIISIGFDYREQLKKACDDIEDQLNNAVSKSGISKEFKEEINKCRSAIMDLRSETDNAFKGISKGKLDTDVFNNFKYAIKKQVKEVEDRVGHLEISVDSLNKALGISGDNVNLSPAIQQFKELHQYIEANHASVDALLKTIKENGGNAKFNPIQIDKKEVKDNITAIEQSLKVLTGENKLTLYGNLDAEKLGEELEKAVRIFGNAKTKLAELQEEMSSTDVDSKMYDALEVRATRANSLMLESATRIEAIRKVISNKKELQKVVDKKTGYTKADNLISQFIPNNLDEEIEDVLFNKINEGIERAKSAINKANKLFVSSFNDVQTNGQIKDNRLGLDIYVRTKDATLWKQVKQKIISMQDKMSNNPAILPIKMVLAPIATKTKDGKNPFETSSEYIKNVVEELNKKSVDENGNVQLDLNGIYNKTYKQALSAAEESIKESIKKIEELFDSKIFNIHLQVPDEEIENISKAVFTENGETKVDIAGQVKNTKEQVKELSENLKEVQTIVNQVNDDGIKFKGFDGIVDNLSNMIEKLRSIESILVTGFGVSSVTAIEEQWKAVEKIIISSTKVDGNLKKNVSVNKIVAEYQKYLNMGGSNKLSAINKIKDSEEVINTIMSKIKDASGNVRKYPLELQIDASSAVSLLNKAITQLNKELGDAKNILKVKLDVDADSIKNIAQKLSEQLDIPINLDVSKLSDSIKNALDDKLIEEWKSKFISSVEQIATKINNAFDIIKSKNDFYAAMVGWADADTIMRSNRTGSYDGHGNNTFSEKNASGELERKAYVNTQNGTISNTYIVDQYGSVSGNIKSELKKSIKNENSVKKVGDVYDSTLHSHPLHSEYKVDSNKLIRDKKQQFTNEISKYLKESIKSLANLNGKDGDALLNTPDINKQISDYVGNVIKTLFKNNKKIEGNNLLRAFDGLNDFINNQLSLNGNISKEGIVELIHSSLLETAGSDILNYKKITKKAIGHDLTFSNADLNSYFGEMKTESIKKLMVESNGMINELDLSSLPEQLVKKIIDGYNNSLKTYLEQHRSEYTSVGKDGVEVRDFTKRADLANSNLSYIIENSVKQWNSSHKSNYSSDSSQYLKQYSVEDLKPDIQDIQDEYLEINNLMKLLRGLSDTLDEINKKDINVNFKTEDIDNIINKFDELIKTISESSTSFENFNGVANINISSDLFDNINASLQKMIDLIRQVNGLASESELSDRWSKISESFNSISSDKGEVNLNKQRKAFAELVKMYKEYADLGGKNSFNDLTDNKNTIEKFVKEYDKLNNVQKDTENNSENIERESSSFKKVEESVDSLITAIGTTKVEAINAEADAMRTACEDEMNSLEWVLGVVQELVSNLDKIKEMKLPKFEVKGFDSLNKLFDNIDGETNPLSTLLLSISDSLSKINEFSSVSNIFDSLKVDTKQFNQIKTFVENLKEIPNAIKEIATDEITFAFDKLKESLDKINSLENIAEIFKSIKISDKQLGSITNLATSLDLVGKALNIINLGGIDNDTAQQLVDILKNLGSVNSRQNSGVINVDNINNTDTQKEQKQDIDLVGKSESELVELYKQEKQAIKSCSEEEKEYHETQKARIKDVLSSSTEYKYRGGKSDTFVRDNKGKILSSTTAPLSQQNSQVEEKIAERIKELRKFRDSGQDVSQLPFGVLNTLGDGTLGTLEKLDSIVFGNSPIEDAVKQIMQLHEESEKTKKAIEELFSKYNITDDTPYRSLITAFVSSDADTIGGMRPSEFLKELEKQMIKNTSNVTKFTEDEIITSLSDIQKYFKEIENDSDAFAKNIDKKFCSEFFSGKAKQGKLSEGLRDGSFTMLESFMAMKGNDLSNTGLDKIINRKEYQSFLSSGDRKTLMIRMLFGNLSQDDIVSIIKGEFDSIISKLSSSIITSFELRDIDPEAYIEQEVAKVKAYIKNNFSQMSGKEKNTYINDIYDNLTSSDEIIQRIINDYKGMTYSEEEIEKTQSGSLRLLSDINLTREQLIDKINSENAEIKEGNRLYQERITLLKDGKVIDSFIGGHDKVFAEINSKNIDADEIIHTHPDDYNTAGIVPAVQDLENLSVLKNVKSIIMSVGGELSKLSLPSGIKEFIDLIPKYQEFFNLLNTSLKNGIDKNGVGNYVESFLQYLSKISGGDFSKISKSGDILGIPNIDKSELQLILKVIDELLKLGGNLGQFMTTTTAFDLGLNKLSGIFSQQNQNPNNIIKIPNKNGASSGATITPLQQVEDKLEEVEQQAKDTAKSIKEFYRCFSSENGIVGENGISWFGDNPVEVASYQFQSGKHEYDKISKLMVDTSKLLTIDAQNANWSEVLYEGVKRTTNEIAEMAKQAGYVGVEFRNIQDSINGMQYNGMTVLALFDENEVKKATDCTDEAFKKYNEFYDMVYTHRMDDIMGLSFESSDDAKKFYGDLDEILLKCRDDLISIAEAQELINKLIDSMPKKKNEPYYEEDDGNPPFFNTNKTNTSSANQNPNLSEYQQNANTEAAKEEAQSTKNTNDELEQKKKLLTEIFTLYKHNLALFNNGEDNELDKFYGFLSGQLGADGGNGVTLSLEDWDGLDKYTRGVKNSANTRKWNKALNNTSIEMLQSMIPTPTIDNSGIVTPTGNGNSVDEATESQKKYELQVANTNAELEKQQEIQKENNQAFNQDDIIDVEAEIVEDTKLANSAMTDMTESTNKASQSLNEYIEKWTILKQIGQMGLDENVNASFRMNDGQIASVSWRTQRDPETHEVIRDENGEIDYGTPSVTVISDYKKLSDTLVKVDNQIRDLNERKEKLLQANPNATTDGLDAEIQYMKDYVYMLELTVGYIDQSNEYLLEQLQITEARNKAEKEWTLKHNSKADEAHINDANKRDKDTTQANRQLNAYEKRLEHIERTYDHNVNPSLEKFVKREKDLNFLHALKEQISNKISNLKDRPRDLSNESEYLEIDRLVARYADEAQYRKRSNNPTKGELGGQDIDTLLAVQIAAYDKLIIKAEKYGDKTKDIVDALKQQRDVISRLGDDGMYVSDDQDYYASRNVLKVQTAKFGLFEAQEKMSEREQKNAENKRNARQSVSDNDQKSVNKALIDQLNAWNGIQNIRERLSTTTDPKEIENLRILKKEYQEQYIEANKILKAHSDLYDIDLQNAKLNQSKIDTTNRIDGRDAKTKNKSVYKELTDSISEYGEVYKRISRNKSVKGDFELIQKLEEKIIELQKSPILSKSQIEESERMLVRLFNQLDTIEKQTKQKSDNIMQDSINKYNNIFSKYNDTPDDFVASEKYTGKLEALYEKIKKLTSIKEEFNSKQFISNEDLDKFKKTEDEIDKIIISIKSMSAAEKGNTEDARWKEIDKISKYLKDNTKISDEAKKELEKYINILKNADPSNIKQIHTEFNKIAEAERTAGREGKSFIDIVRDKFVYGFAAQFAMYFGIQDFIRYLRQGIEVITEFDTALTEMRKVSDETVTSLKNFQQESFAIANSVGATALTIQQSTADWMRLGESMEEAAKSAQISNILLNVSEFDSIDEATESLVAMSKAYSDLDKIEIVDVLNNIGNNFAISTDGLATALQKSASALTTAGNDLNEAVALVTAGNQVVQDPESVGAGLRIISLRLTGTQEAKEELEELGEDVEGYEATVSKLRETIMNATKAATGDGKGFDILDDNGNYKSTYEIMQGLADLYDEIKKKDKELGTNNLNLILEKVAGKNRSNIAASILQNGDELRKVFNDAQDSDGSAQEELDKYLDSIEAKITQLKNSMQEFWTKIINSDLIKIGISTLNVLLKVVTSIVDKIGLLPAIFAGLSAFSLFKDGKKDIKGVTNAIKENSAAIQENKAVQEESNAATEMSNVVEEEHSNVIDFSTRKTVENNVANQENKISNDQATASEAKNNVERERSINITNQDNVTTATNTERNIENANSNTGIIGKLFGKNKSSGSKLFKGSAKLAKVGMFSSIAGMGINTISSMISDEHTDAKSIVSGLGNVATGVGMGSMFGLPGMIIGGAIGGLTSAISGWSKHTEREKEKAQEIADAYKEAKNNIEEAKTKLSQMSDTISDTDTINRYAKLAQGVNVNNNANLNLSNNEYKEFLDISNSLAEVFPTLTKGYDDNGNAILGLGGNVSNIVSQLKDLLDAERDLANQKILENMPKITAGYIKDINDADEALKNANNSVDKIKDAYKYLVGSDNSFNISYDSDAQEASNYMGMLSDIGFTDDEINKSYKIKLSENDIDHIRDLIESLGLDVNDVLNDVVDKIKNGDFNFSDIDSSLNSIFTLDNYTTWYFDIDKNQIQTAFEESYNDALEVVEDKKKELENEEKSIDVYIPYVIKDIAPDMTTSNQSVITSIAQSIDWNNVDDFMNAKTGEEQKTAMEKYIKDNIIKPFNNLKLDEQIELVNLFNLTPDDEMFEGDIQKYIDYIKEIISKYTDIPLNFIIDDESKLISDKNAGLRSIAKKESEDSRSQAVYYNSYNTLTKYMEDNNIVTEESIRLWNKYTEGATSAAEAIKMYEKGIQDNRKDLMSMNGLFDDESYGLDKYQDKLSKVSDALDKLKSRTLTKSEVADLLQDEDLGLNAANIDITTDSFEGLAEELQRVADEGLQDVIDAIGDVNQYKNPQAVQNWINALKEMNKESTRTANALKNASGMAISSINNISSSLDQLGDAYVKLKGGDELDFSDYNQLQETFGDLDSFDEFANALLGAKSITPAIQEMFNQIATEYIQKESEFIGDLNKDNKNIYIQMLEKLGIDNSDEVVNEVLSKMDALNNDVFESIKKSITDNLNSLDTSDANIISGLFSDESIKDDVNDLFKTSISGMLDVATVKTSKYSEVLKKVGLSADSSDDELEAFVNLINNASNASEASINSLISESGASDVTKAALAQLYIEKQNLNGYKIDTVDDINNLITLATTANATTKSLEELEKVKGAKELLNRYGGSYEAFINSMPKTGAGMGDWILSTGNALKEAEEIIANSKDIKIEYDATGATEFIKQIKEALFDGGDKEKDQQESAQEFDWIERALSKVQDKVTDLERTVSNAYATFGDRNTALAQDISVITDQIDVQKQAVNAYKREMAGLGLSQSDINKIKNGTMDIEKVENKDRAEKIQKYMSYYDKVVSLENEIADKQIEKISKYKEMFDLTKTAYDNKISLKDNSINSYKSKNDRLTSYKKFNLKSVDSNYNDMEKEELAKAELYGKEADSLKKKLKDAMDNGLEKYSEEWYSMTNDIEDCTQKQQECYDNIASYAKENFEAISKYYDNLLYDIQKKTTDLNSNISLIEASGHLVQSSTYKELAKNTMAERKTLVDEKTRLETELAEAVKTGKIQEGSSDWYEAKKTIDDVAASIKECDSSLIEFYNNMQNKKFEDFERIQSAIEGINEEADFYLNLMSNKDMYDTDTGEITSYGKTAMGLHQQKAQTYTNEAKRYGDMITQINKQLASDPSNQTLIDKKNEYIAAQRTAIQNAESEKQSLIDLARQGYEAYINSINKTISKLKELHQLQKSEYEYQKNISDKSKNIESLKKQLMAFEGNNSEEARAKIQQLNVSLQEANEDLEETMYDKYISDQEDMLDKLVNDMQEYIDEALKNTDAILSNIETIVSTNTSEIGTTLSGMADDVNLKLSESMKTIWNGDQTPLNGTNAAINNVVAGQTTINNTLVEMESYLAKIAEALGIKYTEKGNGNTNNNAGNSPNVTSGSKTGNNTPTTKTYKHVPKVPHVVVKKGDTLWEIVKTNYGLTKAADIWEAIAQIKKANKSITDVNKIKINQDITLPKYAKGTKGVKDSQLALIDELGEELVVRAGSAGDITALTKGSGVIPADLTANLMEWGKLNPADSIGVKVPNIAALSNASVNSIENNVQVTLDLKNVTNANEFIKELQTNKRLEKVIQSITIDQLSGKNSLNKMKY